MALAAIALLLAGCAAGAPHASSSPTRTPGPPPLAHVFVIMLENQPFDDLYGPGSVYPYVTDTLRPQGTLLSQFYAIGHNSLGNYLALLGGISQTADTQTDCRHYQDMAHPTRAPQGQVAAVHGCVYPSWVPALPTQLSAKGITWMGYMQDMGNDPAREQSTCGVPSLSSDGVDLTQEAAPGDKYAARHNPFVYFAAIRDSADCHRNVVPLPQLATDLTSASTTPGFSFIVPNLCDDGHDHCAPPQDPDSWLRTWIPRIMASPAYRDGAIVILTDEATNDSRACCGQLPGPNIALPGKDGPGGGRIGALVLSPFATAGATSTVPYNDYSLLRSLEDAFGVPHLGYAAASGLRAFGTDVWQSGVPAPVGATDSR